MGKQILERGLRPLGSFAETVHQQFRAEFGQHLQAGSARECRDGRRSIDDQCSEDMMSIGYGSSNGASFGTEGQAVTGVFDIAACDDRPGVGQQSGADRKTAVGGVAATGRQAGGFFQADKLLRR